MGMRWRLAGSGKESKMWDAIVSHGSYTILHAKDEPHASWWSRVTYHPKKGPSVTLLHPLDFRRTWKMRDTSVKSLKEMKAIAEKHHAKVLAKKQLRSADYKIAEELGSLA